MPDHRDSDRDDRHRSDVDARGYRKTEDYNSYIYDEAPRPSREEPRPSRRSEDLNRYDEREDRRPALEDGDEADERRRRKDERRRGKPEVPNYLTASILCMLFCCLPGGIRALVYAVEVNSKWSAGDFRGARIASKCARKWCWISFGVGLLVTPLLIYMEIALDRNNR